MTIVLGLDIGSNSVGSACIDPATGHVTTGVSVFPAGVEESDEKRGDPKNAKRRMTRRTRITLARRAQRKRELRQKLIEAGLLPGHGNGVQAAARRNRTVGAAPPGTRRATVPVRVWPRIAAPGPATRRVGLARRRR